MFSRSLMTLMMCGLCVTLFNGCKAGEAKPAGFAPKKKQMAKDSTLPFHKVWYDKQYDWDAADKIIIRPINTQYVRDNNWWKSAGKKKADMQKDLRQVAEKFRSQLVQAFSASGAGNRFKVTDQPGPNTIVLELAIIELVPTNAWLNAAGMVGLQTTFDKGAMAVEGRVRDSQTSEVIGALADREQGKTSVVSARDFSWYSHAEDIMKDWSKQFVLVLNSKEGEHIEDSPWFTLNPF